MGIEQQVGRIKAQTQLGLLGSLHPPAVVLTRADALHPAMPVVAGAVLGGVEGDTAARHSIADAIEQAELHRCGPARVEAEIDTALADGGPQGGTASRGRQGGSAGGHGVGSGDGAADPFPE